MIYTNENVNSEYKEKILSETTRKLLLSERYRPLDDSCLGFIKNRNEIVFFDKQLYFDNKETFDENYPKIRFHHQSIDDLNYFKEIGLKFSKVKLIHPLILIDKDYIELNGGKYQVERKLRNRYSKLNIEITNKLKDEDDIFNLLSYWDKNKRLNTKITFTGHDKSFLKRFYNDLKRKYKFFEYYFYLDGDFIGYTIIEKIDDDFFISHTRKSKRFDFSGLDYYIDHYSYKDVLEKNGKSFLIETGYEIGQLTNYKVEHFNIIKTLNSYNVTLTL